MNLDPTEYADFLRGLAQLAALNGEEQAALRVVATRIDELESRVIELEIAIAELRSSAIARLIPDMPEELHPVGDPGEG